MARLVKILSIDGGGVRGVIAALLLRELERRSGRRVADLFDLVAGTSTGGVLALGLVKPAADGGPAYSADDLLGFYREEGPRVFSTSVWRRIPLLGNAFEEKYPSGPLEAALRQRFGDTMLSEALVDTLVAAYEIELRVPWFFKSRRARRLADYDFPMWEVARSTTAAPTYFEPFALPARPSPEPSSPGSDAAARERYSLIDGGVYANNPAMCAYVEARHLHRDEPDARFLVVSIGTGETSRPILHREAVGWGLARWARPILRVAFDGVADTVDYQLRQLLVHDRPESERRYFRFQARLTDGGEDLDDASARNLRLLEVVGKQAIREASRELDDVCELLLR